MAEATETTVLALDMLQEGLTLQWEKLCEVQSQQLAKEDVATVMRHLEEVVDALHALQAPAVSVARPWPWWAHPSGYTLVFLLGALLMVESLRYAPVQRVVFGPPVVIPATKKGR